VTQRDRELQLDGDLYSDPDSELHPDPHSFLFDPDDDEPAPPVRGRHARLDPRHDDAATSRRRRRRGRGLLWGLCVLGVLLVGVSAAVIVPKVSSLVSPPDFSGSGTGAVRVTVAQGDTAADIASTLQKAGVVESTRAFTAAAADDPASKRIQPGNYVLHSHMSAKSALALLLDPSSRSANGDVLVTEGATVFDVSQRLQKVFGADKRDAINRAIGDVAALGVPLGYKPERGALTSVEGFLYPATYSIDPSSSPTAALEKMTSRFADADRSLGFAADAQKIGLTPYQALIVASIAQSEAKYPADMAKVARVVLNRIQAGIPLKVDATTRYGALVQGVDPDTITYATFATPYNTYTHTGLPPTPISNPGSEAMTAAVHPAKGNWMFYVNSDAAGHLYFTASESEFAKAAAKCREHNWGCG
jgi:UPF0755 protein